MGGAVRKPIPAGARVPSSSNRSPSLHESAALPASSDAHALFFNLERNAALQPPHDDCQQQQQQHHQQRQLAQLRQPSSAFSNTYVDSSSARVRFTPPHSPVSASHFNDGGLVQPSASAFPPARRPTHLSVAMASIPPNGSTPRAGSLRDVSFAASPTAATAPTTTATKALATLSAGSMAAASSPVSPNSSCSAFSLYSAESSQQELPPLPFYLRAAEDVEGSAGAPTSAAMPPALTSLQGLGAGSRPAPPVISGRHTDNVNGSGVGGGMSSFTPFLRADPVAFTSACPAPIAAPRPLSADSSWTLPPKMHSATTTVPASPAAAHSYSHFLLDMSFDSRAFAGNAAATSWEIERIGHRLQKCQHGLGPSSPHRISTVVLSSHDHPSLSDPQVTSSTDLSPTVPETPPQPPRTLPQFPPRPAPSASSPDASVEPSSHDVAATPFYAETVKFVQVIQQLQRARETGRTNYTWFRTEALQTGTGAARSAAVNGDASGVRGSTPEADTAAAMKGKCCVAPYSSSSVGDNAQSSSLDTVKDGLEGGGGAAAPTSPLLQPVEPLPTATGVEPPPLPSVLTVDVPITGKCSGSEGEKLSPTSADADSAAHLTSSCTATNYTQSTSAESYSCCPVHVTFRPPSIYVAHHKDRGHGGAGLLSPVKRQQLVSGLVDVPASTTCTPRPTATPLPPAVPDRSIETRKWKWCSPTMNGSSTDHVSSSLQHSGSSSSNNAARRAIIDAGVPHRRQLAKKALEENSLFFESILRRQKAEASRPAVGSSTKQ
jgi:hypothetical protein